MKTITLTAYHGGLVEVDMRYVVNVISIDDDRTEIVRMAEESLVVRESREEIYRLEIERADTAASTYSEPAD